MKGEHNDSEKEVWKDVKGYENYYKISNKGRVRSLQRQVSNGEGFRTVRDKIMKRCINAYGYYFYRLCKKGESKAFLEHRLIAIHFIDNPNPEEYDQVLHKNDIPKDNRPENLYWGNHQLNMEDRMRNKGYEHSEETKQKISESCMGHTRNRGTEHGACKLREQDVHDIRGKYKDKSLQHLSEKYNVAQSTISKIRHYRLWKHI